MDAKILEATLERGLFKPQSMEEAERRLKIMTGLASLLRQDPALADAGNAAVVQPWADAHFLLMKRAVERGEFPPRQSNAPNGRAFGKGQVAGKNGFRVMAYDVPSRTPWDPLRGHLDSGRRDGLPGILSPGGAPAARQSESIISSNLHDLTVIA